MTRSVLFRQLASLALAIVACSAVTASDAVAQMTPLTGFRNGPRLDPSDFALMSETARKLYQAEKVADGASSEWRNDKTGSTGTVTVEDSFTYTFQGQKLECRKVRYEINQRGSSNTPTYLLNWCKDPEGNWKIL
jgi:surface antigen